MLCSSCNERQQWLLESGDGSQVICEHLIIDEKEISLSGIAVATMTDDNKQQQTSSFKQEECTIATTTATAAITSRKRKFLTPQEFFNLGGDEIKRKIKPIQKWTTLFEGVSYLMKRVIELGGGSEVRHYAEVENEAGETNNVWISDIVLDESKKYNLIDNDVYIMPLGKTLSKESGFEYHDFVMLKDGDVNEL